MRTDFDEYRSRSLDCLNGIEQQIEKYLVNLVDVMLDFGQISGLLQFDLDGP